MFKRPHLAKTSTPLRSSDLRRLRDDLSSVFGLPASLAKLFLPDGTQTLKVTTHLNEVCTVYTVAGLPLFFRLGTKNDDVLVPTCYAFDLLPNGVKLVRANLVTAQEVVQHLVSGSALFGGGISAKSLSELPKDMKEGDLVSILADGDPRIVAIGQLATSPKELLDDRKGKAVLTLHARGDFLWKSGTEEILSPLVLKSSSTELSNPEPPLADDPPNEAEILSEADDLSTTLSSTTLDPNPTPTPPTSSALTPSEVDTLLRTSLLLSIQTVLSKTPSLLPMPASSLYSNYVLPFRPASNGTGADIKKSSFKNLSQFLKTASKAGVLVTKEVKGDLIIFSVNGTHPDVLSVRPYKTLSQSSPPSTATDAPASSSATSASPPLATVQELLKPPSSLSPLLSLSTSPAPASDLYPLSVLKKLLIEYCTSHSLNHPRDQKFIKIDADEWLQSVLLKPGEVLDVLPKEDAVRRLKDTCQVWFEVRVRGGEAVVKKGTPPVIKIVLKTVGKRMVTLISGFEFWAPLLSFTADSLSDELKHAAASSSTVQPLASSSPKKPLWEIMVQGNQEKLVLAILEKKGMPRSCVVVDCSKVKK